jgi:hypothetical protein
MVRPLDEGWRPRQPGLQAELDDYAIELSSTSTMRLLRLGAYPRRNRDETAKPSSSLTKARFDWCRSIRHPRPDRAGIRAVSAILTRWRPTRPQRRLLPGHLWQAGRRHVGQRDGDHGRGFAGVLHGNFARNNLKVAIVWFTDPAALGCLLDGSSRPADQIRARRRAETMPSPTGASISR